MMLSYPSVSNVRMCAAIGSHNRTLPTARTLPQTIPAQTSIKALAAQALGRKTGNTLPAHCTDAVPPISKLCRSLQIDPVEAFSQELFDEHDLLLYELGSYTTQQIITYLVSWQLGGCITPFALLPDADVRRYTAQIKLKR